MLLLRNLTSARPMSTRPPSALAGGTATRLTSALQHSPAAPSQRIGTAIGIADNVSDTNTNRKCTVEIQSMRC